MYGALWRVLPGNAWVKIPLLIILAAAVVYALFEFVFPWAAANFEWLGDPSFGDEVASG